MMIEYMIWCVMLCYDKMRLCYYGMMDDVVYDMRYDMIECASVRVRECASGFVLRSTVVATRNFGLPTY